MKLGREARRCLFDPAARLRDAAPQPTVCGVAVRGEVQITATGLSFSKMEESRCALE
jgi:hypothetical protein